MKKDKAKQITSRIIIHGIDINYEMKKIQHEPLIDHYACRTKIRVTEEIELRKKRWTMNVLIDHHVIRIRSGEI